MSDNIVDIDGYAVALVGDIKDAIEGEIKEIAFEALVDAINTTVYLHQSTYRQTGGFVDAVEVMDFKMTDTQATFTIGINASRMGVEKRLPNEWNVHSGMSGQDYTQWMAETLDTGSSGSPYYNHAGYGFFDKAEKEMDKSMILAMASALRSKGYKVDIY